MNETAWKEGPPPPRGNTRRAVITTSPASMIRSNSPDQLPGYSQFTRMNSSAVKLSFVLGQLTTASGRKNSRIPAASCDRTASQ